MPKVLIADKLAPAAVEIFHNRGLETETAVGLSKDELIAKIPEFDGLVVRSACKPDADVIAAADNLKVIGRAGIGVDNIDIKAATSKGVVVMNTPFGNAVTTAEHAIAMMFAAARQIPAANAGTQAGEWPKKAFMGTELSYKTLGMIGCGNIGARVAERAKGLQMKVLAYDPFLTEERAIELGVEKAADLDAMLTRADVITLHTPLTDQTRNILSAEALPKDGPGWQVMRLSRNRFWGHPTLIDYMKKLAGKAPGLGWRGLLVGDLAQPRGGPMLTGHASHQIGLDADIWLKPMPKHTMGRKERENVSAVSMLDKTKKAVDPAKWSEVHARLIRAAASDNRVARIFVHAAIKVALCKWATGDRSWLRRVRPWFGHHYHFHVRLKCPNGSAACAGQNPPPAGDGCGAALLSWLKDKPKKKKKAKKKHNKKLSARWKPRVVTLAQLPRDCQYVLISD